MKTSFSVLPLLPGLLLAGTVPAGERVPPAAAPVRPQAVLGVLQARCIKCHGGEKPKAGLSLTSLEGVSRGGKRGPVIAPGKPEGSLLWQMVREGKMPPKQPLPEAERAALRQWIEEGAPGLVAAAPAHWAFRPLIRP